MTISAINIKRIIQQKGLKQRYVAERAGIGEKAFSAMLNERKIIQDVHILPIATALGVTPNDLFATEPKGKGATKCQNE